MINFIPIIIAICFLIVLSIIDVKTYRLKDGFIPAALTTSFLIVAFVLSGVAAIPSGILGFLLGMLLVDLDLFHGVADWKVFTAAAMTLPSFFLVLIFGVVTCAVAIVYKIMINKAKLNIKEIPFIPALAIAYFITAAGGLL